MTLSSVTRKIGRRIAVSSALAVATVVLAFAVGAMLPLPSDARFEDHVALATADTDFLLTDWDFNEAVTRARAEEARLSGIDAAAAHGEEVGDLLAAVQRLQPFYARGGTKEREGRQIARAILDAAVAHEIDPYLAVAIAMRESSLLPGIRNGSRGEQGLFQIMPSSVVHRVCDRDCDVSQVTCNAEMAACYLDYVRELCGESDTWRWVAAYGMSHCPGREEARQEVSARRARQLLVQATSEEHAASVWPES